MLGPVADPLMQLSFGRHVDASRRFVQDQQLWFCQVPAGKHHFLLVAAGQGVNRLLVRLTSHAQCVERANLIPFIYRLHYTLHTPNPQFGAILLGIVSLVWVFDCFVGLYLTWPAKSLRLTAIVFTLESTKSAS